jgi:ESS family glutamate:Na+ symporter
MMIEVDGFLSFTIAILLLVTGKILTIKLPVLSRYAIPEPVAGGFLCAAVVALVFLAGGQRIVFALEARDFLLLLFFSGIGLRSDLRTLVKGGRPLVVLLGLATLFMLLQNLAGMGIAGAFGLDPRAGLMAGSISLTGGVGTTLAWAPHFVDDLGIVNALELGIAANTVGLIAACVIGGPMAAWLMARHGVAPSGDGRLDIGTTTDGPEPRLDYFAVLWAMFMLNITIMLGTALHAAIVEAGINLPAFVTCLIAGILIRNLAPMGLNRAVLSMWPSLRQGLALVSDIALGLFLTMALMGLQLWELGGVLGFIVVVLAVQIALTILYTLFVVFRAMGRDYEAVVMSAGFGGITLGSTATAIANMTAVAQRHGAAHRAFIVVPLVCGFFIDIVNALVISVMAG